LKDMKIDEISLVTAGMNQGANILFTKGKPDWRSVITGEVQVDKAFNAKEARDKTGKWTSAAIGVIGGKQGSYRRQIAQTFADKARAIATGTVGHTVHAVKTTRPTGANPVEGGGVQFGFQHELHPVPGQERGTRVTTSVQIRPEHLGEMTDPPSKAHRALATLHRTLRTFNRQPVQAFGGTKKASFLRASVHPLDVARGISHVIGMGGSSQPIAPTSDQTGGFERRSLHGMPVWMASEAFIPKEAKAVLAAGPQQRAPMDKEGNSLPHAEATWQSAGGQRYYRHGKFIPQMRPDKQRGVERVHDWLAANPALAGEVKESLQRNPQTSNGREFFNMNGEYVPPGDQNFQGGVQGMYRRERDRRQTEEADRNRGLPAVAKPSAARTLFGSEYDTTTNAGDAMRAAREDMMKKGRFFQTAYPESMVKRLPTPAYEPTYRWQSAGDAPGFAPRLTAREPLSKAAKYGRAKAKARLK